MEEVKEATIFSGEESLPLELTEKEYVVFDLETTGTEPTLDMITEIGAVRIKDGKIVSSFQTLVNPNRKIHANIVALTGITDEMVKDAPKLEEVIGDFYKYVGDAILVGHNVDFDYKFIKYHAEPTGYVVNNKTMDTCQMARELIFGLPNYKLNTVGEHFKVKFLHHRALSDAYAAAQIFIELLKIKDRNK